MPIFTGIDVGDQFNYSLRLDGETLSNLQDTESLEAVDDPVFNPVSIDYAAGSGEQIIIEVCVHILMIYVSKVAIYRCMFIIIYTEFVYYICVYTTLYTYVHGYSNKLTLIIMESQLRINNN